MPRTQVHEQGRALSSSTWFRVLIAVDVGVLLGLAVWGVSAGLREAVDPGWFAWLAAVYAALTLLVSLRCIALWAGALVWRRRLSLLAVVAVLWRGGPLDHPALQVAVVLYTTLLWIALLLESRRVALAVAEATGEEVYRPDPTRRVDQ